MVTSDDYEPESYLSNATYTVPSQNLVGAFEYDYEIPFLDCLRNINSGEEWTIGLAPRNEITEYIEEELLSYLSIYGITVTYFQDNDDLEDYVKDDAYEDGPKLCFAVVFVEFSDELVEYRIRFNQTVPVPDEGRTIGDYVEIFNFNDNEAVNELQREPRNYMQGQWIGSGFIQVMNWVDNYLLRKYTGNDDAYIAAGFVPMYFDEWNDDQFLESIQNLLPFFIILSYAIPVSRMISQIVEEKELRVKEMMGIMGLSNIAYYSS